MTVSARDKILPALSPLLPADAIVIDESELDRARFDSGDGVPAGTPIAIIYPQTTEEVSLVVTACAEQQVPLVPQGTRTGVVGGANATDGAVLLNLSRMNRILAISAQDQLATVEAGVITNDLAEAAQEAGLFYPPDPGSVYISTVGGNVATNAGGMRCVKYGTTGRLVRQLTVVTGDGTVLTVGHDTVKGVAGLDLVALLVGSEGTLGIITEITVALLPAPGDTLGSSGIFATVEQALAAAEEIMASPYRPSALELMDGTILRAINAIDPAAQLPDDAAAILIAQSDEIGRAEADIREYARIFAANGASDITTADTPVAAAALMDLRRKLHPSLRRKWGAVYNEDIAVIRSRLPELFAGIQRIAVQTGVPIATGGHIGDGNLHPLIGYDPSNPDATARAHQAYEKILLLAAELGGTITGEHGVGLLKLNALASELTPAVRALQQRIKSAFDPKGILNPGKKL